MGIEFIEKTAKTVDEAITEALIELETTSDNVEIEILEKGSAGLFGIFNTKNAKVRVTKKIDLEDIAIDFLKKTFKLMDLNVNISINFDKDRSLMNIEFSGDNMGVLIGKRGQTLDSLQYLTSLVINKYANNFIRVKIDTENYRDRRKETLEKLAKSLAIKVKKTHRKIVLEPMNPYERRIIHAVLQNDYYVETHSEGDEPYRKVVITPKSNR